MEGPIVQDKMQMSITNKLELRQGRQQARTSGVALLASRGP